MATVAAPLTLSEYREKYAGENGWEYWFGEAVRKPVPTWQHGILQALLAELLYRAGYFSASELDLRIDPNWEPRPDVAGALKLEEPYPTQPIDVAIEILSDDQMTRLLQKCHHYSRIGIPQIFVFDPARRRISQWDVAVDKLRPIEDLNLAIGSTLTGSSFWREFHLRLKQ